MTLFLAIAGIVIGYYAVGAVVIGTLSNLLAWWLKEDWEIMLLVSFWPVVLLYIPVGYLVEWIDGIPHK